MPEINNHLRSSFCNISRARVYKARQQDKKQSFVAVAIGCCFTSDSKNIICVKEYFVTPVNYPILTD
jgi:hypothetical protein